jgi:predicted nucleic acid-binding protein
VHLASRLRATLVTCDGRLARAVAGTPVAVELIAI